jgi:serine/threonine-protein kinase
MGEVDLVQDRDIGRPVALKRLLVEASNPGHLARFVDEVRVIGRLEHPNIVPIHDVGLDDSGRYYFVMKYVDGETLESVISRLSKGEPDAIARYDVARRVEIFIGLLRALEYAHAAGIIHRDLKPANVMVGRFGEVVLMDWGVACTLDRPAPVSDGVAPPEGLASARLSSTQAGALVGTPQYMSPEQTRGAQFALDVRSDLYSACVLFHELLGLRHRHADETSLVQLLVAINTSEPPSPSTVFLPHPSQPDGIGAEYGHFVRRGLARNPDERWQTAREMIDELHAIRSGYCQVQCPVTFMKRATAALGHLIDKHPQTMMVVMGSGVAAIVGLIAFGVVALVT